MPARFQLSRAKGWRMPDGGMSVARPTPYGNMFAVSKMTLAVAGAYEWSHVGSASIDCALYRAFFRADQTVRCHPRIEAVGTRAAVEMYDLALDQFAKSDPDGYAAFLAPLAGKDLGCWCEKGAAWCHADILLARANPGFGAHNHNRFSNRFVDDLLKPVIASGARPAEIMVLLEAVMFGSVFALLGMEPLGDAWVDEMCASVKRRLLEARRIHEPAQGSA